MPRANRYFLPGLVWHVTHRCHEQRFLLKFARDRRRYLSWLFEARRRYGLCILNYVVTSNHVHLLLMDTGGGAISRGMQLVAGRTAQEFNLRKGRQGAFWEDRYHATAVETGEHLRRCVTYIDLNMVRAGVVHHPENWPCGGYREIQCPPRRYALIDVMALCAACGYRQLPAFQHDHRQWTLAGMAVADPVRDGRWTEVVAVGGEAFVTRVKRQLDSRARSRTVTAGELFSVLREPEAAYSRDFEVENSPLSW